MSRSASLFTRRKSPSGRKDCASLTMAAVLIGVAAAHSVADAQPRRVTGLTPSPPGAVVYFLDLQDGATVPAKLKLNFGLRDMGIAPAGSDRANSGHHHLLIDTELPPLNKPIPNDFNHLHFGAGQTETEITLKPGQHTLQLLMGDKDHVPHTPPVMSQRIRFEFPLSVRQRRVMLNSTLWGCKTAQFFLRMRPFALASSTWEWHLQGSTGPTPATITSW